MKSSKHFHCSSTRKGALNTELQWILDRLLEYSINVGITSVGSKCSAFVSLLSNTQTSNLWQNTYSHAHNFMPQLHGTNHSQDHVHCHIKNHTASAHLQPIQSQVLGNMNASRTLTEFQQMTIYLLMLSDFSKTPGILTV